MPRTTDLAIALRDARYRCGLSTQDAADKIGVARQTVANWESGLPPNNRLTLNSIAAAYGLDPASLVPLWAKAKRTRRRRPSEAA